MIDCQCMANFMVALLPIPSFLVGSPLLRASQENRALKGGIRFIACSSQDHNSFPSGIGRRNYFLLPSAIKSCKLKFNNQHQRLKVGLGWLRCQSSSPGILKAQGGRGASPVVKRLGGGDPPKYTQNNFISSKKLVFSLSHFSP
ncbi:Uncharacterized protein TCM_015807 [Theobroma cacao]|uniref:Uncharacterized protein n=1 Tax=Theobroma cacao TaxID=3641 RepID=A0A061G4M4_THECC|nr:Uncharacterized protein TCM_015807 [Theobroma cacao]